MCFLELKKVFTNSKLIGQYTLADIHTIIHFKKYHKSVSRVKKKLGIKIYTSLKQ